MSEPLPYTVAELLSTLKQHGNGKIVTSPFSSAHAKGLTEAIREVPDICDAQLVGAWAAAGGFAWMETPPGLGWLSKAGKLVEAVGLARAWDKAGRPQIRRNGKRAGHGVADVSDFSTYQKSGAVE